MSSLIIALNRSVRACRRTNQSYRMSSLKGRVCATDGYVPVPVEKQNEYLEELNGWKLVEESGVPRLRVDMDVENFVNATTLVQRIAVEAEMQCHHPDVHITGYKNLRIEFFTHDTGNLSENDFIMAYKLNEMFDALKK